jgi:hypothetical protein
MPRAAAGLDSTRPPSGVCPLAARAASRAVQPSPGTEDPLDKLDQLVDAAPEPENAVLTDNTRVVRWAGPMFALLAAALLPWTVYLGLTLPSRQESQNYDVAWAGFDVFLLVLLASTAFCALRRSRYLSTAAGATAALLVVDAWFDCLTTTWPQELQSIAFCILVELPLAGLCVWLSYHTHQIAERRILLLRRRARRR